MNGNLMNLHTEYRIKWYRLDMIGKSKSLCRNSDGEILMIGLHEHIQALGLSAQTLFHFYRYNPIIHLDNEINFRLALAAPII